MQRSILLKVFLLCAVCIAAGRHCSAEELLRKVVRVSASNTPLGDVLKSIGRQGGFSFSYGGHAVAAKRPVTLEASAITVEKALDELLQGTCTYKQVGNHIVLQASKEKYYQVSGYVLDASSGQGIPEASVYERQQLVAAVTNNEGYFRLRLRHQYPTADISISKERYQDTSVYFASVEDKVYRLPVRPATLHELEEVTVTDNPRKRFMEQFLSRLFLGNRMKAQTRNITRFIAERPVQTSFVPGLGTHGRIGAQVVNKFSLNVLGGYTAGVQGVELGGLFNINSGDVGYAQAAGLFNVVGGDMAGVQLAGLSNTVADSVTGVQASGLSSYAGSSMHGVQLAGISNVAGDSVQGVQAAGVTSIGRQRVNGAQVSGVANIARGLKGFQAAGVANLSRDVRGVQVSGVLNVARKLEGVQIGLINIADTAKGASIGLINLSRNGYHKLAFYSDEIVQMNAALKTGTGALYTILLSGFNAGLTGRAFSFGAGLGHQTVFSKRWSLTTEATLQHLYLGDWDHTRLLGRIRPSICYQPVSWLSFYAGPSVNVYQPNGIPGAKDYLQSPEEKGFGSIEIGDDYIGWIGWQVGFALF